MISPLTKEWCIVRGSLFGSAKVIVPTWNKKKGQGDICAIHPSEIVKFYDVYVCVYLFIFFSVMEFHKKKIAKKAILDHGEYSQ